MQIFEQLLDISELSVLDVKIQEKEVHIQCHSILHHGYCPACKQTTHQVKSYRQRNIRDLSLLGKIVYLLVKIKQFYCPSCQIYFNQSFSFVDASSQYTYRYEQYLYKSCQGVDISYVAKREDLSWDKVNDIFTRYGKRVLVNEKRTDSVRYLGIDEIALRKGHKDYCCVLVNLETGQVIDLLPDRSKEYLTKYFKELGSDFCNQIQVVSSDMWEGYSNLCGSVFPNAQSVVDRFHFFFDKQDVR